MILSATQLSYWYNRHLLQPLLSLAKMRDELAAIAFFQTRLINLRKDFLDRVSGGREAGIVRRVCFERVSLLLYSH